VSIEIRNHGRLIGSVFELLGSKEDDITKSIGWALANCNSFRDAVCAAFGESGAVIEKVLMQEFGDDRGFTDIELIGPSHHVIIEAKRGWWLPGEWQLTKYSSRLQTSTSACKRLVAMSDCTRTFASLHLPTSLGGISLSYLGWRDIAAIANNVSGSHAEKRLLWQLAMYLGKVATMQDVQSNWVYVVSLSGNEVADDGLTWIDIVEKHRRYFHPVGKRGFPKEPPNYVAFRYWGQLQSIHHIDSFEVSTNPHDYFPQLPDDWDWEDTPHYVYSLGPEIRPGHVVKNGPSVVRSARVWAMLDLLLTCETITEARNQSYARQQVSEIMDV
jgi:hypothetical protein